MPIYATNRPPLGSRSILPGSRSGGQDKCRLLLEANAQTQRLAGQFKKSLSVEQKDSHLSLRASCTMDAFLEAVAR